LSKEIKIDVGKGLSGGISVGKRGKREK